MKVQVGGFPYNMSPILVVMAPPASWALIDPALAGVTCYSGRIHQALDGATHLYGVGNLERKEWWKHHRDWGILPKAGGKAGCGISTCVYVNIYIYVIQMCMFVHIYINLKRGIGKDLPSFQFGLRSLCIDAELNGLMNHALLHQPMMGDRWRTYIFWVLHAVICESASDPRFSTITGLCEKLTCFKL